MCATVYATIRRTIDFITLSPVENCIIAGSSRPFDIPGRKSRQFFSQSSLEIMWHAQSSASPMQRGGFLAGVGMRLTSACMGNARQSGSSMKSVHLLGRADGTDSKCSIWDPSDLGLTDFAISIMGQRGRDRNLLPTSARIYCNGLRYSHHLETWKFQKLFIYIYIVQMQNIENY